MINYLKKRYDHYKKDLLTSPSPFFLNYLNNHQLDKLNFLKKKGYVEIKNIISDQNIKKAREVISSKIKNCDAEFLDKQDIWKISFLDDFNFLFDDIFNSEYIKIINHYFKRQSYLADVDIRRVLPVDYKKINSLGKSNSDWHKDTRGRQLKIMIYLTDVSDKDSYFSFIPQTHNDRTYSFAKSRYNEKEICLQREIKWFGKAGEAMLFDTNIQHRLNRQKNASLRDTITLYFTPGQHLRKIFKENKNISKKNFIQHSNIFKNSFFEDRS